MKLSRIPNIITPILISILLIILNQPLYCHATISDNNEEELPDSLCVKISPADSIVSLYISKFVIRGMMIDNVTESKGKLERYIVDRGETWASIGNKHSVDEGFMRALNPFDDCLYTGIEILIPVFPKPSYQQLKSEYHAKRYKEAAAFEKSNEWKKAIKIYTKVIDDDNAVMAHYLRGRAYYNNGKLKQATTDFEYVVNHDSENQFPDARTIYNQVSAEWARKKQQRAQFWGNLALGVLQTGLEVANTYYSTKYAATNTLSTSGSSRSSFHSNYAANPINSTVSSNSFYHNGISIPRSLDYTQYFSADMMRPVVTYDNNGTPMFSYPNLANATRQMQADFNRDLGTMEANNFNNVYGNTLLRMLSSQNNMTELNALMLETPAYAADIDNSTTSTTTSSNADGGATNNTSEGYVDKSGSILSLSNTYDRYVSMLIDHENGNISLQPSDIKRIKEEMKNIRQTAKRIGNVDLPISKYEY